MLQESVAILAVVVLIAAVFARSRHYAYAVAVVPLLMLPFFHLLVRGILYLTKGAFILGIRPAVVIAFTDVLAIIAGCVCIVLIAQRMQSKRVRNLYLLVTLVYSLIMGWTYVFSTLKVLFVQ